MSTASESGPSSVHDLAALGRLWEEHKDRLLAMLDRRIDTRLRQRVGADAVLHDTFLEAARNWTAYQAGSPMKPYPWLYRLALDRLIAEYRKEARPSNGLGRELPFGDDLSAFLGGQLPDTGTGPFTKAKREEQADRMRHVLGLLPDADRDVVAMRYYDQLSTQEICDVLNARAPDAPPLSVNTANVRLFRALKKMRQLWAEKYGEPEVSG